MKFALRSNAHILREDRTVDDKLKALGSLQLMARPKQFPMACHCHLCL